MAKVIQLIKTHRLAGTGKVDDPSRAVVQLFTLDGKLVAEYDPCGGKNLTEKSFFEPLHLQE